MGSDISTTLTIGSRGSELALAQVQLLAQALDSSGHSGNFEVKKFSTSGDQKRNAPRAARDKHDWIAEIQDALLSGEVDIALHSGKDVPVDVSPETVLLPVLERSAPNDVCITRADLTPQITSFDSLPEHARIGTSSLRRQAQLLARRPDLQVDILRGNVPTRIAKLNGEQRFDAIVLAEAGLARLGLEDKIAFRLSVKDFIPAMNQGILIAQIRAGDTALRQRLLPLSPLATRRACSLERAVVAALGADCRSALGVYAALRSDGSITLAAQVCSVDGTTVLYGSGVSEPWERMSDSDIEAADALLASALATDLLEKGAKELLHS